jgi:hypothetical protein
MFTQEEATDAQMLSCEQTQVGFKQALLMGEKRGKGHLAAIRFFFCLCHLYYFFCLVPMTLK